jgi:hypothetical protein
MVDLTKQLLEITYSLETIDISNRPRKSNFQSGPFKLIIPKNSYIFMKIYFQGWFVSDSAPDLQAVFYDAGLC